MTWQVYIVKCADGSFYTGSTNDLEKRIETHNSGKGAKYTASRLPVQLVYNVEQSNRSSALKLEAHLKKLTKAKKAALVRKHAREKRAEKFLGDFQIAFSIPRTENNDLFIIETDRALAELGLEYTTRISVNEDKADDWVVYCPDSADVKRYAMVVEMVSQHETVEVIRMALNSAKEGKGRRAAIVATKASAD